MLALNIGSGQRPFKPPFLNYDIQEKWKKLTEDAGCWWVNDPKTCGKETVDIIVLHHLLEHFGCGEADSLIEDSWRLLKHNGSLIVCVPNMRALAQAYLMRNIDTQIYMTNVYGAYMGDEADRHKWGYDSGSIHKYLTSKWSWCEVKQFNFRQIEGADIAKDWWILALECVR